MEIFVDALFAVPLIRFKFSKHHLYNFPEVPKKHRKPPFWIKSLNTSFGFSCEDDDFLSIEMRSNLVDDITDDLIKVFESVNIPPKIYISDFWYNIYHDNQGQEEHDHLCPCTQVNPFWSGIYYNKNPTPTRFIRNDRYHRLTRIPGIENSKLKDFFEDGMLPEVEPGDIILFPPWVEHSIDTKECTNMRLTFSFNIDYNDE
jgi:hypothetical protein